MEAAETISVVEGYDAMRIFLETVWRRLGRIISKNSDGWYPRPSRRP